MLEYLIEDTPITSMMIEIILYRNCRKNKTKPLLVFCVFYMLSIQLMIRIKFSSEKLKIRIHIFLCSQQPTSLFDCCLHWQFWTLITLMLLTPPFPCPLLILMHCMLALMKNFVKLVSGLGRIGSYSMSIKSAI